MTKQQRAEDDWATMLEKARQVSERAYSPYSQLRVGAVLRGNGGEDYAGCNVENSSLGLTTCAERTAVVSAVAAGERSWSKLLIYTADAGPLSPCGACRQVLAEFCRDLPIVSVGRGGLRREMNLRDLLPQAFTWPLTDPEPGPAGNETERQKQEARRPPSRESAA